MSSRQVAVTNSATLLHATTDLRFGVLVRNRGTAAVYLGKSDVTTSTGYQLDPGEALSVDLVSGDGGLYGIAASGSHTCHVLQQGA